MPELPEVEFAARSLRRWLKGRVIESASAPPTRVFRGSDREAFERKLPGEKLEWIERRGKYLLLGFSGDVGLLSHLGMTGKWVRRPRGAEETRHVRARLLLAPSGKRDPSDERERDGAVLYDDPRLFGRIAVHPAGALFALPEIAGLGPDPLVDGIDAARLHARLQRTSREIKVALLDQAVLAGVGNIQATDALFRAKLHPSRRASSLSLPEVRRLAKGIQDSIDYTLGLATEDEITYVEEPGADNPFLIYGRAGSPCPRCTHLLEKMVQGGRTTAFCPHCQRS